MFIYSVVRLRYETRNEVTLTILNSRYENRIDMHTLVDECRVGAHQLKDIRLEGSQTQCVGGIDIATNTHIVQEVGNSLRLLGLLHHPR